MDEATRAKLAARAWDELMATATADDSDEQWTFVFRTEGSISLLYCPWSMAEEWDFDGQIKDLQLSWSEERRKLIDAGAELDEEELRQWRRAVCHKFAGGSDWTSVVWIVPLRTGDQIDGYVAFVFGPGDDPDEPPELQGVYESIELAKAGLAAEGALAEGRKRVAADDDETWEEE